MINRSVSAILVAALLSGCVATNGTERPDSASGDDQTATRVQGSLLGALVGGLIGAAAGDKKGALIGAATRSPSARPTTPGRRTSWRRRSPRPRR